MQFARSALCVPRNYTGLVCSYACSPLTRSRHETPAQTSVVQLAACSRYARALTPVGALLPRQTLMTGVRHGGSVTRASRSPKKKAPRHATRTKSVSSPSSSPRSSQLREPSSTSTKRRRGLREDDAAEADEEEDLLVGADEEDSLSADAEESAMLSDRTHDWTQAENSAATEDGEFSEDAMDTEALKTPPSLQRERRKTVTSTSGEEDEDLADRTVPDTTAPIESKYLADAQPDLAAEYTGAGRANSQDIKSVKIDSGAVVSWRCPSCQSVWKSAVFLRCTLKNGCPQCEAKKHPSVAQVRPDLVALWQSQLNDPLDSPETVPADSRKQVFWQCGVCRESYRARVKDRVKDKALCPSCSAHEKEERGDNAASKAQVRALLEHEWHPLKNGDLQMDGLRTAQQMQTKVWWLCSQCSHTWVASVSARLSTHGRSKGRVCPQCHGKRK